MPRPATELHDQFILQREADAAVPDDWPSHDIGGWRLAAHPNLPVTPLVTSDGAKAGWLLGYAISAGDGQVTGEARLPFASRDAGSDAFESWLYAHGGRFAAVLLAGGLARFYLDPCGSLSAVYATDPPRLASTNSAMHLATLEEYARRKAAEPVLLPNQFQPAGLTSDPDVRRLLPNHYLDLDRWAPVRHWPASPIERSDHDAIPALVREIVEPVRANIEGITGALPGYLGLTAGRDSRMVLACARGALDRIRFVTFIYEDEQRKPDIHTARRIARRFGLAHVGIPLTEPDEQQKQEYLLRTGFAGHWGKSRDFDLACRRHLEMDRAWITGFGGEVGRAFYWREGDAPNRPPTPEALVERLNLPRDQATLEAWRRWQAEAPHQDSFDLLDLAYIEQRMGCWAGPHMYGAAPFGANLSAFSHRRAFVAMMSLPVMFRRRQGLADAVIAEAWPELASLPYQQFTGLRLLGEQARQRARAGTGALVQAVRRNGGRFLRAIGAKRLR